MVTNEHVIDTLATIEHISHQLDNISKNTNSFGDVFSTVITIFSIAASIASIVGLTALYLDIRKRHITKDMQEKIILDLLRHFMVNNAILENIKNTDRIPIEGIFSRFATLDSDTDIGRLSVKAEHYEKLHNISLSIRNYNSVVFNVDRHLHTSCKKISDIKQELDDISKRSIEITEKLFDIAEYLNLDIDRTEFRYHINDYVDKLKNKAYSKSRSNIKVYYNEPGLSDEYDYLIERHSRRIIYES